MKTTSLTQRMAGAIAAIALTCGHTAAQELQSQSQESHENQAPQEKIFLPSADCLPDPVLDSITVNGGHVIIEDHLMTSGEADYIMHRVNPTLYEKRKTGQTLYLCGIGGLFVGTVCIGTGHYWRFHEDGAKHDAGKALFATGIPLAGVSALVFVYGLNKSVSAKKEFLRNCLGISCIDKVELGTNGLGMTLTATF